MRLNTNVFRMAHATAAEKSPGVLSVCQLKRALQGVEGGRGLGGGGEGGGLGGGLGCGGETGRGEGGGEAFVTKEGKEATIALLTKYYTNQKDSLALEKIFNELRVTGMKVTWKR